MTSYADMPARLALLALLLASSALAGCKRTAKAMNDIPDFRKGAVDASARFKGPVAQAQ